MNKLVYRVELIIDKDADIECVTEALENACIKMCGEEIEVKLESSEPAEEADG